MTDEALKHFFDKLSNRMEVKNPQVGEIFDGKYKLEAVLGSGGLGIVYSAVQIDSDRIVAIKVLRSDAFEDEESKYRFLREGKLLGQLSNPHIVGFYDFAVSGDGVLYLCMEYLKGESVQARLEALTKFPVLLALSMIKDVASALSEVHKLGIIHRDLKLENLFIADAPELNYIKVLDFGLAKEAKPGTTLTAADIVVGTPVYMSPEQCQGMRVDFRSDIYSLTVCLYEMITGVPPFTTNSSIALFYKHLNETVPVIEPDQVDKFHPALNRLIATGMAKVPADRFSSMDEMIEQINTLMQKLSNETGAEEPAASRDSAASKEQLSAPKEQDTARLQIHRPGKRLAMILLAVAISLALLILLLAR